MNIKTRILLAVFFLELFGYGVLLLYNHSNSRETLESIREQQIQATIKGNFHRINALTKLMEHKAIELAESGEMLYELSLQSPLAQFQTILQGYLESVFMEFPESIGGGLWYEPYLFGKERRLYGPYVFWNSQGVVEFTWDLNTEAYNYPSQDWYLTALPKGSPRDQKRPSRIYWTPPYWDEAGSKELMMTVDAIMYSKDERIIGLRTVSP